MTRTRRLALVAAVGAAALLLLLLPAGGQTIAPPVVLAEPGRGSVSVLHGSDIVEIASGLFRPVVVASDPSGHRIVVGQAGPAGGPAAIIAFAPDGSRSTLAAGLPGLADLTVAADGQIIFVTGTDGNVRATGESISTEAVATVDGIAIGLALLDAGRLFVMTQAGLGSIVDLASGSVEGVLQLPGVAPGRPVTLADPDVVCVPDAVQGEVRCSPLDDGTGFLVDGLPGARAVGSVADGQLAVAHEGVVALVSVPDGVTLRQWALDVSDVDVLSSPAAWLGTQPTAAPAPSAPEPDEGSPLWLLLLGTTAGLGAILLTLAVRSSGGRPPSEAPTDHRPGIDDREADSDV